MAMRHRGVRERAIAQRMMRGGEPHQEEGASSLRDLIAIFRGSFRNFLDRKQTLSDIRAMSALVWPLSFKCLLSAKERYLRWTKDCGYRNAAPATVRPRGYLAASY